MDNSGLKNKNILIGVTGGIAAYKTCELVSRLSKTGAKIQVIMTQSATEFVSPLTFQTLTSREVVTDMFRTPTRWDVEHIELAKEADLAIVVPATANIIGKIANGIADDMLTTTLMATKAPIIIAPAMNTNMWTNPIVQENIGKLRILDYYIIPPESGLLACKDNGEGKLASIDTIEDFIYGFFNVKKVESNQGTTPIFKESATHKNKKIQGETLHVEEVSPNADECGANSFFCGIKGFYSTENEKNIVVPNFQKISSDLEGLNIIVTAGPTIEAIDPVRFITNRSTGKMGYAISKAAISRGAKVTLISGKTNLEVPSGLKNYIEIESANDLYEALVSNFQKADVIIQSAAVADYRPLNYSTEKIKKKDDDLSIPLTRNKDIALEIGKLKEDQILIGFAAETQDLIENAKKKVEKKNLDFIVANDLTKEGAGFNTETNIVKIIHRNGEFESLPQMSKIDVGHEILDRVLKIKSKIK